MPVFGLILFMNHLTLSAIIGQEIIDVRYHYDPENEYGLQAFHSYYKLSGGSIIGIPHFDDEDYLLLTTENVDFFNTQFETGQPIADNIKIFIVGQKIVDFYFSYYHDETDLDSSAFIRLSNNYYLTETNYGPIGLHINLSILDNEQILLEVQRRAKMDIEVRSYCGS